MSPFIEIRSATRIPMITTSPRDPEETHAPAATDHAPGIPDQHAGDDDHEGQKEEKGRNPWDRPNRPFLDHGVLRPLAG